MKELAQAPEDFSPDTIHQALVIVKKSSWTTPIVLGTILFITILFMTFGRIPVTGEGNALLMTRGTVIPFQATAGGQISRWHVKVGDVVNKGQLLAELEQPEIEKRLEQSQEKLQDLNERNESVASLQQTYQQLSLEGIDKRELMLASRIKVLDVQIRENKGLVERNRAQNLEVLKQKKSDLQGTVDLELKRAGELAGKLKQTAELEKQKLRSKDQLLSAKQTASQAQIQVADARLQLLRHGLNEIKATETYLNATNQISSSQDQADALKLEIGELRNLRIDLEKQTSESDFTRRLDVSEVERQISRDARTLNENRQLKSEYDGRVLELTAAQGERINKGVRLGTIDTRNQASELEVVAYFEVKHGKQIKPGMTLRLTPATVQRERFGSLIAIVSSVSSLPVSAEGVAAVVGNTSVANNLIKDGKVIEVVAELQRDESTTSGYRWDTSGGPEIDVTSGTLAQAIADIEVRPPLTFVVPILRDWAGFSWPLF